MRFLQNNAKKTSSLSALILATLFVGVCAGLSGMCLALLLHYLQHLAYGYSPSAIISNESFLEGVRASSALRRILILSLCGLIAGIGWWCVYRFGKPLVSIATAVRAKEPQMPLPTTFVHVLLQIITIALGSPLGREVAPRELSALFAGWISNKAGLSRQDTQIMLACAAGAGLAAVYNVPLGGALFTLEVLLCTLRWSAVIPALTTSVIAVVISWIGLGNEEQYPIADFSLSYSLVIWSIFAGPIFGFCAYGFSHIAAFARKNAPQTSTILFTCFFNFLCLGLFAIYFPSLLGNGKSPAELEFTDEIGIGLSIILLILRTFFVLSSLRAGAQGGLLTPSLAIGALLAVILGGLWNVVWPNPELGAYAIVGAAAFLAAAQKMPITAIVLLFEFTHMRFNFIIPLLFSVSGALGVFALLTKKGSQQ
jgi:H+/Cl- antiporter ClcA